VLELPGSLFVRQLTSQLISVPKLDRQGLYTLCGDGQARIYTKSGQTLCIAPLVDNLYQLTVPEVPRALHVRPPVANQILIWHLKLGHLSEATLRRLAASKQIKGMPEKLQGDLGVCEPCLEG
jgi:hypothetical protein